MNLKEDIKPITYLKNNAAKVISDASTSDRSLIVTQNGEAQAVVIGIKQYNQWRRSLALLKLIAQGEADVAAGRLISQDEAFNRADKAIRRTTTDG